MTAELAVKAVENACLNVRDTEGIILHSDLGSQYKRQAFEDCLSRKGIQHSFSRKGDPYDNACIESFHSVLKKEEIYLHTYQDPKEARRAIFKYIEGWYDRKRIHIIPGFLLPMGIRRSADSFFDLSGSIPCSFAAGSFIPSDRS